MDKSDTRIKVGIASQPFFKSWHADWDKSYSTGVKERSHLFKAGHFQAIGFVHQNKPSWINDGFFLCRVLS
jgi:hypothetical protein